MEENPEEPLQEEPEPWYKGPLRYVLAAFLILLLVIWIPSYYFNFNPRPKNIPSIQDVAPKLDFASNETFRLKSQSDFARFVNPEDPALRQIAAKVVAQCDGNKVCATEALYLFVRNNINYVADPVDFEYVEDPKEVLSVKGADCESGTMLLATLLESVGINAELVFIPRHAFLRVYLPEASRLIRYGDWVYLDWTCSECDFGEVPQKDLDARQEYMGV